MQIVDAIKNLVVAMKGSGSTSDIPTDQIAEAIQYIADTWESISSGMGSSYTLPEATTSSLGGVKKAAVVTAVSSPDATTAGAAYDQTVAQSAVTLANANKTAINAIISSLQAAGIMDAGA